MAAREARPRPTWTASTISQLALQVRLQQREAADYLRLTVDVVRSLRHLELLRRVTDNMSLTAQLCRPCFPAQEGRDGTPRAQPRAHDARVALSKHESGVLISPWHEVSRTSADPRVRLAVARTLWLASLLLDRSFCCRAIRVGSVQAHAGRSPCIIEIGGHHIPALAKVQHPVVAVCCPALGCDADPRRLGHI